MMRACGCGVAGAPGGTCLALACCPPCCRPAVPSLLPSPPLTCFIHCAPLLHHLCSCAPAGGEHALSSDDLFSFTKSPGKTLVVGASYVALECAGFLAGVGCDVTIMVRSILLRGFDQQIADVIGGHMGEHGVRFVRPAVPTRIEKQADGKLKVTWVNSETGAEASELYDTVFTATGREADLKGLNLASAGVPVERDGKIKCADEQTAVPHIYAIGDVVSGKPELTPVAIMAGRLLAQRLFGGASEAMDYDRIPTTVFTPLEYGAYTTV